MVCQNIGTANPDIAGVGVVVAFAFQAILAFLLSVFAELIFGGEFAGGSPSEEVAETELTALSATGKGVHLVAKDSKRAIRGLRREALRRILLACSDIQTTIGLSLALTGIVQYDSLTLYQYHIIYDTISLVSISNCAATASIGRSIRYTTSRTAPVILFLILYLVFVILFGIRLRHWDETREGYCYHTNGIALQNSPHPTIDECYLAATSFYMFCTYCYVMNPDQFEVLGIAMLQLPLHLYFIIRLRLSNEPLLQEGDTENEWGFGQIYALVSSAAVLTECVRSLSEYRAKRNKLLLCLPRPQAMGLSRILTHFDYDVE